MSGVQGGFFPKFLLGLGMLLSFAQGQADVGFYPLTHQNVPYQISVQARSIFRIIVSAPGVHENGLYKRDYRTAILRLQQLKERLGSSLELMELRTQTDVELKILQWCQEQGLNYCPMARETGMCSSSLVGTQKTLLTAGHCIPDSVVKHFEKPIEERVGKAKIHLTVINSDGKVVFNSLGLLRAGRLTEADLPYIERWGADHKKNDFYIYSQDTQNKLSDYAFLKLPTPIAAMPLALSNRSEVQVGMRLFAVGYPDVAINRVTPERQSFDCNGMQMYVTMGQVYKDLRDLGVPEEIIRSQTRIMGPREENSANIYEEMDLFTREAYATNLDSRQGQSGGPVFDEQGNLVGVVSFGIPRMSPNTGRWIPVSMAYPQMVVMAKLSDIPELTASYGQVGGPGSIFVDPNPVSSERRPTPLEYTTQRTAGDPRASIAEVRREQFIPRR